MLHAMSCGGLQYLVCFDECRTWAYEQTLDPCGDALMSSVVLDDHTLFIVYRAGLGPPQAPACWYQGLRGRWIRRQA